MKKIMAILLALVLVTGMVSTAAAGWESSGGGWWYSKDGGGYYQNEWLQDGAWYYFDGSGWMVTGWRQIGGAWYYFAGGGAMVTGWQQIGGAWYYFDAGGAMATGWRNLGAWYYFDEGGAMATGWRNLGSWYYFDAGGAMVTGWLDLGGTWYYFDEGGAMVTGTRVIDGKEYTFDAGGAWIENAAPAQTGWVQNGGVWTYYDENGVMATGWAQIGGTWYYFDASGAMATGWKAVGGAWYYFDASGAMQTGWLQQGDDRYYLNAGGAMVTSDTMIDGVVCAFDASGKYLGKAGPIRLVVYSYTNELQNMIEKYFAPKHPEVEFDYQIYPTDGNAYTNKLDTMLGAASDEAPDIVALEAAFVKHYVESDKTGDLKEIGFTDEEMSAAFPVVVQIGQNADGVQKALSWQCTPGVLVYRASLAEKYLGVKSPEEFQAKVADWDTFLETAENLKNASGGACRMVTGYGDIWNAFQYQRDAGWVVDGKLNIDDQLLDYEEMVKAMYQDDLTQEDGTWTEAWFAGMNGVNETMCYFLPTWGLHYTLKPNCVANGDDIVNDEVRARMSEENGGTYGDWRLTEGPTAYNWGGTWMGINAAKAAVASEAKKSALHNLIYDFSLNEKTLEQYAKDTGDFVGNIKTMEKIAEESSPDPFLGGQNSKAAFVSAASKANGTMVSEYDDQIGSMWNDHVTEPYVSGEKSLDECISYFKAVVREAFPTIAVE